MINQPTNDLARYLNLPLWVGAVGHCWPDPGRADRCRVFQVWDNWSNPSFDPLGSKDGTQPTRSAPANPTGETQ